LVFVLMPVGTLIKAIAGSGNSVETILTWLRFCRGLCEEALFHAFPFAPTVFTTLSVAACSLFSALDLIRPITDAQSRVEKKSFWTVHHFMFHAV